MYKILFILFICFCASGCSSLTTLEDVNQFLHNQDIVGLIQALDERNSSEVQRIAVNGLIKLYDKKIFDLLIDEVNKGNKYNRKLKNIAEIMGTIKEVTSIDPLYNKFKNAKYISSEAKKKIIWAFGNIGGSKSVETLIEVVVNCNLPYVSKGTYYDKMYGKMERQDTESLQEAAVIALSLIDDPKSINPLITSFEECIKSKAGNTDLIKAHIWVLRKSNDSKILSSLIRLLDYTIDISDDYTTYEMLPVFKKIYDKFNLDSVSVKKSNTPPEKINDNELGGYKVAQLAEHFLVQIGQPAVNSLLTELDNKNWLIKYHAAMALGRMKDTRSIKSIIQILLGSPLRIITQPTTIYKSVEPPPTLYVPPDKIYGVSKTVDYQSVGKIGLEALPYIEYAYNVFDQVGKEIIETSKAISFAPNFIEILKMESDSSWSGFKEVKPGIFKFSAEFRKLIALNVLKKITGEKFGYDYNSWNKWWEENKSKYENK